MSTRTRQQTEHVGQKGHGRKDGYWGTRERAKATSRKLRRRRDRQAAQIVQE